MAVKVVEAIGSETGGKDGQKGDQTGNEIVVRTFKKRSYDFTQALRCTSRSMAEAAVSYAERIALCPKFGYSQPNRWTGPKNIEKVGKDNLENAQPGDFDCSSLVIESYRLAGCPLKMTGYTGSMYKILMATGYFEPVNDDDIEDAELGDVLIAPSIHTLLVISDGSNAKPEPISSDYVEIIKGKVNVRKAPAGRIYCVARQGDTFPYLGYDEPDSTGKLWWAVDCDNMTCYISSANPKHAVLVEGV